MPELQMDAYVNWCFRHLAALRGLAYDCVLGLSIDPWTEWSAAVHGLRRRISAQHVAAAASHMLNVKQTRGAAFPGGASG